MQQVEVNDGAVTTDDALVERHLEHLRTRNLRPSSIYQRGRALARLRQFAGILLLDITAKTLAAWWDDATKRVTPETRAGELSHLRGFYTWAVREELIDVDPTARLSRPKLRQRLPRPMPDADVAIALANAPERIRPWLFLATYAGLRACEIATLRVEDVWLNADPPVIFIHDGKGGKQRIVPVSPLVAESLDAVSSDGLWMFPRRDGNPGPNAPWTVCQLANTYLHSLGIAHTLHTLRHWFGTSLYRTTRDLRLTQEMMGHSSPVTTAGYAAWAPGEAAGAIARLSGRLPTAELPGESVLQ